VNRRLSEFFSGGEVQRDGGFADLGHADSLAPGTVAYCDSVHYLEVANANANVSCILVTPELAGKVAAEKAMAVMPNPRNAFYRLHERLELSPRRDETMIHPSAIVSAGAKIGKGVIISERVVIRDDVEVGDGSFIDAGAILGAEGILYIQEDGNNQRIRHRGTVCVGSNAVILANAVVVRAIHPGLPTVIGDHAIVGIASTIGHEAHLERNCVVSGNCVIARRARIGEGAWIGTSATVREYVRIGARASVKAGSVVIEDVAEEAEVSGNFAGPHRKRLLQYLRDKK
jgi:UDP-3-O-[3-hydroxymyristoyl] glucosamine N-acyltransferase